MDFYMFAMKTENAACVKQETEKIMCLNTCEKVQQKRSKIVLQNENEIFTRENKKSDNGEVNFLPTDDTHQDCNVASKLGHSDNEAEDCDSTSSVNDPASCDEVANGSKKKIVSLKGSKGKRRLVVGTQQPQKRAQILTSNVKGRSVKMISLNSNRNSGGGSILSRGGRGRNRRRGGRGN